MKDKDGGQLLPVTTTEQVKRGGAGNSLETSMLELENLVPLAEVYGFAYDDSDRTFSYGSVDDISIPQMKSILKYGIISNNGGNISSCAITIPARVAIVVSCNDYGYGNQIDASLAFAKSSRLEEVNFIESSPSSNCYVEKFERAFSGCSSLRVIDNILVNAKKQANVFVDAFKGCSSLETVKIGSLATNISFADSPLLSYDSIKFLIDNAANTSAITVTVHADVYAKLAGTATDYGDNTKEEWMAVMASATEKQISFATA